MTYIVTTFLVIHWKSQSSVFRDTKCGTRGPNERDLIRSTVGYSYEVGRVPFDSGGRLRIVMR